MGKSFLFHRGNSVSIGKGTWGNSIGASLKSMYALNKDKQLDLIGLSKAIRCEIADELKIELPKDEDFTRYIFAFYRDLVEGGKPLFLFYYKTDLMDSRAFKEHFNKEIRKSEEKRKNKKKVVVDGTHFKFVTIDELKNSEIHIEGIKLPGSVDFMHMMPSSAASVAILINCL